MIGYFLKARAARTPQATALVYGPRRRTYAQLNERACRLANALAALGVRKGDRVAVLLHNCDQFFDAFFAAAKLGAIFVPLNFRLVAREIGLQLEGCAPAVLLASRDLAPVIKTLEGNRSLPPKRFLLDDAPDSAADKAYDTWLAAQSPAEPEPAPGAHELLMLVHASATAGRPKAVVFTHATAHASCVAKLIDLALSERDIAAVFGPLFHAGPLMDLALPLLLRGGAVVIGPSRHFDPAHLMQTIAGEQATVAPIYPTMLRRVLDGPRDIDLPSLRMITAGGEVASPELIQAAHERFPHAAFVNTYGSTEGGQITTFLAADESLRKAGSVGREAFSVEVRIADAGDRAVAPGAVGEVLVRSPFVCRGYWNQSEATAAASRNGWWHTGDLARRDDEGFIWLAGRSTDLIKSGAEAIYPVEVEQVIAQHPAVEEVGVIGVPDAEWGEAAAAFVVTRSGARLTAEEVVEYCHTRLAGYKKPRHVVFVESLPRGTTDEVSREALRAMWASGAGTPEGT